MSADSTPKITTTTIISIKVNPWTDAFMVFYTP
jgi:hypothetical protein